MTHFDPTEYDLEESFRWRMTGTRVVLETDTSMEEEEKRTKTKTLARSCAGSDAGRLGLKRSEGGSA